MESTKPASRWSRGSRPETSGPGSLSSFTIVADLPSGSVDAAFGSCSGWWASWAEQETGNEFAPSHIYAAHDLQCGADHLIQNRTRMTRPDRSDRQPSIQVVGLGNAANIVWSRDTGPETGELRISAATPSVNWSPSRVITGTQLRHDSPQLRLKDGQRKVAWSRQSRASVGNLPPGVKLSLNFQSGRTNLRPGTSRQWHHWAPRLHQRCRSSPVQHQPRRQLAGGRRGTYLQPVCARCGRHSRTGRRCPRETPSTPTGPTWCSTSDRRLIGQATNWPWSPTTRRGPTVQAN